MKVTLSSLLIGIGVLTAVPMYAHHAFSAEFDKEKKVTVEGVVTKLEWSNPHVWFYVDVKDSNGSVTNWGFSTLPPGVLVRKGVTKQTLKPGDVIRVEGYGAKDGSNNADANSIVFADGRKVTGFSLGD